MGIISSQMIPRRFAHISTLHRIMLLVERHLRQMTLANDEGLPHEVVHRRQCINVVGVLFLIRRALTIKGNYRLWLRLCISATVNSLADWVCRDKIKGTIEEVISDPAKAYCFSQQYIIAVSGSNSWNSALLCQRVMQEIVL